MKKLIIIFAVLAVLSADAGAILCDFVTLPGYKCPTGTCACSISSTTECCTSCAFQVPCLEPQVHGTVFYNSSGTLIRLGGATVTASGRGGTYTAKTDSLGNYSFGNVTKTCNTSPPYGCTYTRSTVLPQGYYNITVINPDYGIDIKYNAWAPSPANITCWDASTPVAMGGDTVGSGGYCIHNCTCNTRPFKNLTLHFIDCGLRIYDGSSIIIPACEPLGTLTSPLRLSNKGNIYGIVLVDTTSTYASKARIQTTSGIKALRKL